MPIVAKLLSAQVCPTRVLPPLFVPLQPVIAASMGKHFSPIELDNIHQWKSESCSPLGIHRRLVADRRRKRLAGPDLTTVRRHVKGKTFKRAAAEVRGRKRALSDKNLATLDRVRGQLITKVDGDREVTWAEVMAKARAPKVCPSTVAKYMKDKFGVQARPPRLKPYRETIDEAERKRICNRLRKLPGSYWQNLHLIMDNKKWPCPRSVRGQRFAKKMRVRRHLRKRSEGLKKGFTKPDKRKHRVNLQSVNVCAGIIKGKVRVWHYLGGPWCGDSAAALYKDIVAPALRKHHGNKRRFTSLEDNDPTGYKSTAAKNAKRALNIIPIEFPTYSPDLNPCDYSLWEELENRMAKQKAPKHETMDGFKARLRRTALAIPEGVIRKMIGSMVWRTQSVYDNDGGHIPRD